MVKRVDGENHVIDWNGARYDCAFRRGSTAATDETSQGNDGPDTPKLVGNAHQVTFCIWRRKQVPHFIEAWIEPANGQGSLARLVVREILDSSPSSM